MDIRLAELTLNGIFDKLQGTSDKAVGLRSAMHQYMGGSEIQTYSIMADADCVGKLIAGLVTRLR
ncbi:TPA: hypothetical protein ACH3X1_004925 [Trebouxia sp. C0004]